MCNKSNILKSKIKLFPKFKFIQLLIKKQPPEVFCKKSVLRKTPVPGFRAATLLKKRLCHRCFPVNFAKFLRTPFL